MLNEEIFGKKINNMLLLNILLTALFLLDKGPLRKIVLSSTITYLVRVLLNNFSDFISYFLAKI